MALGIVPTPGGPSRSTFSLRVANSHVASSSIVPVCAPRWNASSKPSSVFAIHGR